MTFFSCVLTTVGRDSNLSRSLVGRSFIQGLGETRDSSRKQNQGLRHGGNRGTVPRPDA